MLRVEFFVSGKKMKEESTENEAEITLSGMTEGNRENEQGKQKQTFK